MILDPVFSFPSTFETQRSTDANAGVLAAAGVNLAIAELDAGNVCGKEERIERGEERMKKSKIEGERRNIDSRRKNVYPRTPRDDLFDTSLRNINYVSTDEKKRNKKKILFT